MMRKEEFTVNLKKALEMKMEGITVVINPITKNNGLVLTGIVVKKPNAIISPTIYVEEFYGDYQNGRDFDEIVDKIIELAEREIPAGMEDVANKFTDVNYVKENVIAVVVNAERNEKLLSEVPHIIKEDLAVYFKVMVNSDDDGMGTITIRSEHLPFIGNLTIEELYEAAMANIRKTANVMTMAEVMKKNFGKDIPEAMVDAMFSPMPPERQMYIVSNNNSVAGAINMFNTDLLDTVVETVDSNLYILPSSIHEVIAVSENLGTPDSLSEMVREVNGSSVAPEEQLSDNVYYYNSETKEVSLVS